MILLKLTEKEAPVVLEALHFFGAELSERLKHCSDNDVSERVKEIELLDQIIDVIQLTGKK